jgi:hypothetical protein
MKFLNKTRNTFKSPTERFLEKLHLVKKPTPALPQKLTKTQARILQATIERGEIIGGSFAQKVLYPQARQFQDIDIISKTPQMSADYITSKLKIPVTTTPGKHGKYVIKSKLSGKVLADVVPSKFYEKYIKQYGEIPHYDINGIKILKEDVLYMERKNAIRYGNRNIRKKNMSDIKYLSDHI